MSKYTDEQIEALIKENESLAADLSLIQTQQSLHHAAIKDVQEAIRENNEMHERLKSADIFRNGRLLEKELSSLKKEISKKVRRIDILTRELKKALGVKKLPRFE